MLFLGPVGIGSTHFFTMNHARAPVLTRRKPPQEQREQERIEAQTPRRSTKSQSFLQIEGREWIETVERTQSDPIRSNQFKVIKHMLTAHSSNMYIYIYYCIIDLGFDAYSFN